MLQWQNPILLFLLLLVPVLLLLFAWHLFSRRKKLLRFADSELIKQLVPAASLFKLWLKFSLIALALVLMVIGLANPQLGNKTENVKRKGVDVMIALDVSNSMMCQDVPPSRLIRAKQFVSDFIDGLDNDRIGLIVFAGNAYVQMPLTVDYSAARMYLRDINPSQIPSQGTDIGGAVERALESFPKGEKKYKALVIITDGEDNEGESVQMIRKARTEGVVTHVIGVGSPQGGPIPEYGPEGESYKTDAEGNIVMTKMNESMVRQLAAEGNGKSYVLNDPKSVIASLNKELDKMDSKTFSERVFTDYENYFQWFLFPALILFALEFFLSERKSRWMEWLNPFKEAKG